MKLAHFSDPHISLPLPYATLKHFNIKQWLGWVNWVLQRRRKHEYPRLSRAVQIAIDHRVDAVLISGDICQLGLQAEMEETGRLLRPLYEAKIPCYIVTGNHDYYATGGCPQRFWTLREEISLTPAPSFDTLIKLDDIDLLLTDMGRETPPFVSYGECGAESILRYEEALSTREKTKPLMVVGHYPLRFKNGWRLPKKAALQGDQAFLSLLDKHNAQAYLCGHIHHPFQHELPGGCIQYCAGSITAKGVLYLFDSEDLINGTTILSPRDTDS